LQPLFYQLTLDSATEFLLGESVDILRSPADSEQQLFGQAFDFAQTELGFRVRLGPFVWLYRNKEFDLACARVHSFIDRFVAKALEFRHVHLTSGIKPNEEKRGGKYIFMNELALATNDPVQIRSELLNILLAGRDTTAGLLSNTLHVLARRPDIWAKLKDEVDQLQGKRPDYETLRNMKYLKNVLNECKCFRVKYLPKSKNSTADFSPQLCVCTPRCLRIYASPTGTQPFPREAGRMASLRYSSPKVRLSPTVSTACTDARTYTEKMQTSTGRSAGRRCGPAGATCRSMAGRGSALDSNLP